jgi:hypothetical protein
MTTDHTQRQTDEEEQLARKLSLQRTRPPIDVSGYDARQFLGSGAYGEVWVAVDQNTGRRVAIKFYTRRSGVEWSQLSREVEKLVFLSTDRHVVQLLDVGWDANPPYYVMEYIENGSLEKHIEEHGALNVGRAVEMLREVATGLLHAHGKGVLHCDLKPANVLLDQDNRPRLADFGQSRLSHEQTPALGTLFYMAPEQADLEALPDARWDVYALGALLYCMLTGEPPYRSQAALSEIDTATSLVQRLERYRQHIRTAPPPAGHRQIRGVDRDLAEILDRCLAIEAAGRFANVQSVLNALRSRDVARDRKPLLALGLVGPLLFLLVVSLFGWLAYLSALNRSDTMLRQWTLESSRFAAKFVSEAVARRIDRYFRAVEQQAGDPHLQNLVTSLLANDEIKGMLTKLADPRTPDDLRRQMRRDFIEHPARQELQRYVEQLIKDSGDEQNVASWFITSAEGIHLAAEFDTRLEDENSSVGGDFSWRSYFHGGPEDLEPTGAEPIRHIEHTHLSAVFQSMITATWKIAVSTPITNEGGEFLGIVALTVELGRLGDEKEFTVGNQRFVTLVDGRQGKNKGVILQHPLFDELLEKESRLPDGLSQYRVPLDSWPTPPAAGGDIPLYHDPLAEAPGGSAYRRRWIAAKENVKLESRNGHDSAAIDPGLVVLVQENYDTAATAVQRLGRRLLAYALIALSLIMAVTLFLWYVVARALRDPSETLRRIGREPLEPTPLHSMETLELPLHRARETTVVDRSAVKPS